MSDTVTTAASERGVEVHHIDPVPEGERSGRARDLFALWFSSNLNVGNAVYGIVILGLIPNIWLALTACVVGNVIGTALMALHSVQGARLGIPQLIQSRGQFGFFGALVPVAAAALMYLGFTASVTIIGGQSLAAATGWDLTLSMLVIAVASFVVALVGYHAIHIVCRWAQTPLTVALLAVTAFALFRSGGTVRTGSVSVAAFLTGTGVAVTFALTYAPFVSDYSRYLPSRTSGRAIFGWTAAGTFLSAAWVCMLGVVLTAKFPAADTFQSASDALGGGASAVLVLLVTAAGLAVTNVLNVYGGMLNLVTGLATFVKVRVSFATRTAMLLPTFAVGTLAAVFASSNYTDNLTAFLSFLVLVLVPWGAVNLVDYYLVQRGHYDVPAMYVRAGRYWSDPATWTYRGFNLSVLIAYVAGVAAGLPFISNPWWSGPLATVFGGDISWIPGLLVATVVYLGIQALHRGTARRSRATAVAAFGAERS